MPVRDNIEEAIQSIFRDIKAEAVIADLMEKGFASEDFVVVPNGAFKRRYSRDIAFIKRLKLSNGQQPLGIYINRDAIYDELPEGFFHNKPDRNAKQEGGGAAESKRLNAEENAARDFFLPFENELFLQKIQLELEERKIFFRFCESLFVDIFPAFWNIDAPGSRKYVSRMVKFLHFAYKMAGDFKQTEKCLEAILGEKVSIQLEETTSTRRGGTESEGANKGCMLGNAALGVDFVCGDELQVTGKVLVFLLGPLKETRIADYLENGAIADFLQCFYRFFIPADLEVKTRVLASPDKQKFLLEPAEGPFLGYQTVI